MNPGARALLRLHHRRALWTGALWIAVAGLTLDLVWARLGVDGRLRLCALGLAAVGAVLARVFHRQSRHATARALDAKIDSRNRVEAVAEVEGLDDPLAAAMRTETDAFLQKRPPPRSSAWFAGLALLAALLIFNLAGFNPWNFGLPAAPAPAAPLPKPAPVAVAPPAKPPTPPPPATLRWLSPEFAIAATPKEDVPLTAQAESATGLGKLVLHLTLNCDSRPALPLPYAVLPGSQVVPLSLPLDGLEAQPYDIVTYHLGAERVLAGAAASDPPWPATFSPLQFVELRATHDEPTPIFPPGGDGTPDGPGQLLDLVRQLKLAQMEIVRATFNLDHDLPPRSDAEWPALVKALAADEKTVAEKTAEFAALSEAAHVPADALALVAQARLELQNASVALARPDLAAALSPARCALAALSHAEKLYADFALAQRRPAAPKLPADEETLHELPPREQTPEGRLEKFATDEKAIADQLAAAAAAPDTFEKQDHLARELEKLAAENQLPPDTIAAIKSAAAAAKEAAAQLNEQDARAATEPATRAAQTLQDAAAQRDAAGRTQAAALLAAAQRGLLRSAGNVRSSPPAATHDVAQRASAQTGTTRDELRHGALREQQQGSAAAAQQLDDLASAIDSSKVANDLNQLAAEGEQASREAKLAAAQKLTGLAGGAAAARAQVEDPAKLQARALDELRRDRANLDHAAAAGPEAMNDLYENSVANAQTAASAATDLPPPPPGENAPSDGPAAGKSPPAQPAAGAAPGAAAGHPGAAPGTAAGPTGPWQGGFGGPLHRYAVDMAPRLDRIISRLDAKLRETKRAQTLTTGNPADAPPAYRAAVSDYFESLSRQAPPPVPSTAPAPAKP